MDLNLVRRRMLEEALRGLGDPSSVDFHYAGSLLPQPLRNAWQWEIAVLYDYYEEGCKPHDGWPELAGVNAPAYEKAVMAWLAEFATLVRKGLTDKKKLVQGQRAESHRQAFRKLSPAGRSWFINLHDSPEHKARMDPKVVKALDGMGEIYVVMWTVDRDEDRLEKMRAATMEWLRFALDGRG